MINAVNAVLECVTNGLFTAGFMVFFMRLGWFPIMIVQYITQEEQDAVDADDEDVDYE